MSPNIHICLVGPASSGKTLYQKRLQGEEGAHRHSATVGAHVEILNQLINGQARQVYAWEISGSIPKDAKKQAELRKAHLQQTELVLVFCNLNDPQAFELLSSQFSAAQLKKDCKHADVQFALIGTQLNCETPARITEMELDEFAIEQGFDISFVVKDPTSAQFSLRFALEQVATARRRVLIEKLDAYCAQRTSRDVKEILKTIVAYLAWILGLSRFFGHSKIEDKLFAATALKLALEGCREYLNKLTQPQQSALTNARLSELFKDAQALIPSQQKCSTETPICPSSPRNPSRINSIN